MAWLVKQKPDVAWIFCIVTGFVKLLYGQRNAGPSYSAAGVRLTTQAASRRTYSRRCLAPALTAHLITLFRRIRPRGGGGGGMCTSHQCLPVLAQPPACLLVSSNQSSCMARCMQSLAMMCGRELQEFRRRPLTPGLMELCAVCAVSVPFSTPFSECPHERSSL